MSDLYMTPDQELLSSSSASSSMLEVNENRTSAAISPLTLSLNNCRNSVTCQTFTDHIAKEHNSTPTSLNLSSSSSTGFDWKAYTENEKNDT